MDIRTLSLTYFQPFVLCRNRASKIVSRSVRRVLAKWAIASTLSLSFTAGQWLPLVPIRPAYAGPNICATPGKDGPINVTDIVNTYFPPQQNATLASGETSIVLDSYYTEGADTPITEGDMLMIVQMQDATIDSSNTAAYGSGNTANDGRGQSSLGNTGVYEFVRATNSVPLGGGTLTFEGGNTNNGVLNTYVNADATATRGRRTFQVIRMVQYASLSLTSNITVPDWNGQVGGVLALDIAGDMNFNGFTIDGTARGFRGGFIPNDANSRSGANNNNYVLPGDTTEGSGKGEGIAGTPRYMWDGTTAIDLGTDQLPGGDAGRGAPGNAGGGGNAHNAGGGGGSNGGDGGVGGIGWEGAGGDLNGSRGLGGAVPVAAPVGDRLIMGGGGGGGDVNNDPDGIRGGQGGGIVMIRADRFVGGGTIISDGSDGEEGDVDGAPDGAGGGGAGGTVALFARSGDLSNVTVRARGGQGGNTDDGNNVPHGPGGGGGGGLVVSYSPGGQVVSPDLAGGASGRTALGTGFPHGAADGLSGRTGTFNPAQVPPVRPGAECFPELSVTKTEADPGEPGGRTAPGTADYSITVTNAGPGGATGVRLSDVLPTGFTYSSGASAVLSGGASGPTAPANSGTAAEPIFGDYTIPEGGAVTVTFPVDIADGTAAGTYQNPAYVSYLDPSRTTSGRRVTPSNGAISGTTTTYESGSAGGQPVVGSNYVSSSSAAEDVVVVPQNNSLPLGSPFLCDSTFYITVGPGGGTDQQLYSVDRSGSVFSFDPIGPATTTAGGYPTNFDYNALAYNPIDDYIYAYINRSGATTGPYSPGNVIKIGSDGVAASLGKPVTSSPNGNTPLSGNFFAGAILSDGTYVIGASRNRGQDGRFATLDLSTTPPTIINSATNVTGIALNDFAVDPRDPASVVDGNVYAINESGAQDRLIVMDVKNFPPSIVSQAPNPTGFNHNAGSQFVDAFGALYYRSNSTDTLYQVDTDANSPTYGVATAISSTPGGGNHDGVSCLFATAMEKTVTDLAGNPIATAPAGEVVRYEYRIATGRVLAITGVTFEDDLRSVASGLPLNSTFTGNASVSNGSGTATLSNGDQTLRIDNLTLPAQSSATPEGASVTIIADVRLDAGLAPDTYFNQATLTGLPAQYPPVIPSDYPPSAPYEDPTPIAVTEPVASDPNVLLAKRITAINRGIAGTEQTFDSEYVDVATPDDNDPQWPGPAVPATTGGGTVESYIAGITGADDLTAIANITIQPGDELEYTIPFLSNGDATAQNVLICDRIPTNTQFIPNAFNSVASALPNSSGDRGILFNFNGIEASLTNANDGDEVADTNGGDNGVGGYYFPAGVDPSSELGVNVSCGGPNDNGAVVVDLSDVPNAVSEGSPVNSYGFVRFRVAVD